MRIFLIPLYPIFQSENFRFPFFYEKYPKNRGSKIRSKLQKTVGNLLDKLRKLCMDATFT